MHATGHRWLLPIEELTTDDLPRVGAKNLSIGWLHRLGLATPRGFALSTEAFGAHLVDAGVTLGSITTLEEAAEAQHRVLSTPLGAETCRALSVAIEDLGAGGQTLAARSSLYPFEDDPRHACAGLFVSHLNVRSGSALVRAVAECFASLFEGSTLQYFQRHGLALEQARMSVGLQQTVDAVASATVFTLDPTTGSERLLYIDAAHGFGGVTNSALVETDSFFLDKSDPPRLIARRKGTKRRRLVRDPAGGLALKPNPSMGFALDEETLQQIARDACQIERAAGAAQDIELAVGARGELVYLQARAALPPTRTAVELVVEASGATTLATGTAVVFGAATAALRRHHDNSRNAEAILLSGEVAVRDVPKMVGARGLVVRHLPPTSHPAIHLREVGVPTISVGDAFAAIERLEGQEVTIDTTSDPGRLYAGSLTIRSEPVRETKLPGGFFGIHLLTTYPSPLWSSYLRDSAVEGVHVRGESINNDDIRTHPLALLAYDEDTLEGGDRYLIERRIAGYPDGASFYIAKFVERLALIRATLRPSQVLTLRLTDLQTPDYRRLIGGEPFEQDEANPALGLRGVARLLHPRHRRLLDLELTALAQAVEQHPGRYQLMIPVVRAPEEMKAVRAAMASVGLSVPVGMMVETPAAVLLARRFAPLADFFCVGAADLTQLLHGADRTHAEEQLHADPAGEATLAAVRLLLGELRGAGKDIYLAESLLLALHDERALRSNNRLKVITWPDRLLRTARALGRLPPESVGAQNS